MLGQIRFMLLRRHLATAPPLRLGKSVNQHRGGTPPTNVLKLFNRLGDSGPEEGPDWRRSGPHPSDNFEQFAKLLRASPRRSPASVLIHTRMIVAVSEAVP